MKILYDFRPTNSADTVTITASTSHASFPTSNLKNIEPVKSWKSTVITQSWVKFDFGGLVTYNSLFLNRINFASCIVATSTDDITYTTIESITGLVKDEIYDENYIHRWVNLTGTYRYIKITIPAQTPAFDPTYFKIGNILVGTAIDVWNPKAEFQITYIPKMAITEFKSGYIVTEKLGRTRRGFNGVLSKVKTDEIVKFRLTHNPFVLYLDYTLDATQCFLVKAVKEYSKSFQMSNIQTLPFTIEELV